MEDPDAGQVLVGGRDLSTLSATQRARLRRTDVGFVFQGLNLIPSLTALENVMLPLEVGGVAVREARERARAALVSVGIVEQVERFPDDFSGGQQQRIAVARAVVGTRQLVLADEPTGALDSLNGEGVMRLASTLRAALINARAKLVVDGVPAGEIVDLAGIYPLDLAVPAGEGAG